MLLYLQRRISHLDFTPRASSPLVFAGQTAHITCVIYAFAQRCGMVNVCNLLCYVIDYQCAHYVHMVVPCRQLPGTLILDVFLYQHAHCVQYLVPRHCLPCTMPAYERLLHVVLARPLKHIRSGRMFLMCSAPLLLCNAPSFCSWPYLLVLVVVIVVLL